MKRTNKKKYNIVLFTLILALGVIAGAYALLSDTVTLTGTATVVEADNVSLEITSVSLASSYCSDTESDFTPTYNISSDKKTVAFNYGDIVADVRYGAYYLVTITNTGNVPVSLSSSMTSNGLLAFLSGTGSTSENLDINFGTYTLNGIGYPCLDEILAVGESCTFTVECYPCGDTASSTAVGTSLTASIAISGTSYTGSDTPLNSHTHTPIYQMPSSLTD